MYYRVNTVISCGKGGIVMITYTDIKNIKFPLNLFKMVSGNIDYVPKCPENEWISNYEQMSYSLTPREDKVIKMRYFNNLTLRKIGEELSVGQERIRQMEAKSLRKLRKPKNIAIMTYGYEKYESECKSLKTVKFGDYDKISVCDFNLSTRAMNAIYRNVGSGCKATIGDILRALINDDGIIDFSKIMKWRCIGTITYKEIVKLLNDYSCKNGMKIDIDTLFDKVDDHTDIVSYEIPKCTIKELFIIRGDKITKRRTIICGNCETEYHSEIFDPVDMTELHCPNCGQLMIDNKFIE